MGSSVALFVGGWIVVSVPLALAIGRCIAARDRGNCARSLGPDRLAPPESATSARVVDLTDRALVRSRHGLPPG